jgi:tetratricopeptide (TPR) repeat protein
MTFNLMPNTDCATSRRRNEPVVFLLLLAALIVSGCNRNPAVRKQKFLEQGDRYFSDQHYGEAVIEYKNALRVDPAFGDAYYRLGLALLQQGEWSSATESFSRAVQFSPDNIDARLRLGDILVAAGQYGDARAQADAVLQRDPQNASVPLMLGQIQLQQKKYDAAELEFEQARQRAPQDAVPYGDMALAQLLGGKFDEAEKNFQKATELAPKESRYAINWANFYRSRQQPDRAEQVLRQSMTQNPTAIELPLAVADLYVHDRRTADAKRILDETEANSKSYPTAQREVADFYAEHSDPTSALDRYFALAKKKSDPTLIQSIVSCYLQLGKWPDAEQWIDKEDKKDKEPAFQLLRARTYMGTYRLNDAISELQGLIRQEPDNTLAYSYLSQAHLQKGDLQAARTALVDALQVQPGNISALVGLGNLSLQQNDSEGALAYSNQIVAQSYWVVNAHLVAGNAYVLRDDAGAALREFQIASALDTTSAAAQERVGRVLSAEGKYADAEKAYETALAADPGYALALSGLVDNFRAQGQPDRARARIDQQIERDPQGFQIQLIKGQFCLNRGEWDCSEQSFKKAIELNSYDATAYMGLAGVYEATNRGDEAVQEYEAARTQFPDFLPTYVQLGRLHEARGEFDQAKQTYQAALQIEPNYVPALNNLAWLDCEHGGSLNEALELAQQAKRQQPDDPHVNDTLGWVYYKRGLYPSAVGLLESAVVKSPKEPGYQYHLGMVYLTLGKQEEGRKTLQAALRVGLNPDDAKAARAALQKAGS